MEFALNACQVNETVVTTAILQGHAMMATIVLQTYLTLTLLEHAGMMKSLPIQYALAQKAGNSLTASASRCLAVLD